MRAGNAGEVLEPALCSSVPGGAAGMGRGIGTRMGAAAAARERAAWGIAAGGAGGGNGDGVGGVSLLFSRRRAGSGAVRGVAVCVPSPDIGTRFLFAGGAEQLGLLVVLSGGAGRSEEHTSELQSLRHLVCR